MPEFIEVYHEIKKLTLEKLMSDMQLRGEVFHQKPFTALGLGLRLII